MFLNCPFLFYILNRSMCLLYKQKYLVLKFSWCTFLAFDIKHAAFNLQAF